MSTDRFRFVTDDDFHNYIIPADKRADWEKFLDSDEAELGEMPEWAREINSVCGFTFTDPQEDK